MTNTKQVKLVDTICNNLKRKFKLSPHTIYDEIKQNSNYCIHPSDNMNHLSYNHQTYIQSFVKSKICHIGEHGIYSFELKHGGSRDVSPQRPLADDIEDACDDGIDSLQGNLQILAVEMIIVVAFILTVLAVIKFT